MIDRVIKSRRSVRKFKSKKPDWRVILDCVDSMRYAPMAGGNFSLKFVLVDEPDKIEKISEACEQNFVSSAQYVLVVCSDGKRTKTAYEERADKYLKQQAGAAIQNFLLSIENTNLSTCWIGHFYDDKVKRILRIPENVEIEAIFPIGYPYEKRSKKELVNFDGVMFFNEYKKKRMNSGRKLNT